MGEARALSCLLLVKDEGEAKAAGLAFELLQPFARVNREAFAWGIGLQDMLGDVERLSGFKDLAIMGEEFFGTRSPRHVMFTLAYHVEASMGFEYLVGILVDAIGVFDPEHHGHGFKDREVRFRHVAKDKRAGARSERFFSGGES